MKVIITDDYQAMSQAAARLVIKQIKKDKNTVLGLPTGGTPLGLYKGLVKAYEGKKVSFKQIKIFNLDEYVGLVKSDSRSYHAYMRSQLFDLIDVKDENVFMPDGEARNLSAECAGYEALIKKHQGLDLLILGIGLDGHIGFNEPGSDFHSKVRAVKLNEQTRRANARYFNNLRQVPRQAITMGLATIMKAKKIILLASGRRKAEIIKRALTGKIAKSVPASILQRHKNLTVILDKGAARDLIVNGRSASK